MEKRKEKTNRQRQKRNRNRTHTHTHTHIFTSHTTQQHTNSHSAHLPPLSHLSSPKKDTLRQARGRGQRHQRVRARPGSRLGLGRGAAARRPHARARHQVRLQPARVHSKHPSTRLTPPLSHLPHTALSVKMHAGPAYACAWSPTGRHLLSCGEDGLSVAGVTSRTLKVWAHCGL